MDEDEQEEVSVPVAGDDFFFGLCDRGGEKRNQEKSKLILVDGPPLRDCDNQR